MYPVLPVELRTTEGMPLLADSLQSIPFHQFAFRHHHFNEHYCRKEHNIWIPLTEFHPEATGFTSNDV